jgi:hypothetical protein
MGAALEDSKKASPFLFAIYPSRNSCIACTVAKGKHEDKQVQALHVEIRKKDFDEDHSRVQDLYTRIRKARDFPLWAPVWLIPDIRDLQGAEVQSKATMCLNMQAVFVEDMHHKQHAGITAPD